MHNRKAVTKVLYHAFVILFGFMMVYPVLWMISGSFKGNAEILRGTLSLIPKELKLTNYATGWKGFGGTTFATFFTNSIFITVIATFGTVISSSLVAYALSRVRFRGRKFWFTCIVRPVPWVKADDIVVAFHILPPLIFLIAEIGAHTRNGKILAAAVQRGQAIILTGDKPAVFIKDGLHSKFVMLKEQVLFGGSVVGVLRA